MGRKIKPVFATLRSEIITAPPPLKKEYTSVQRIEITNHLREAIFWRNSLGLAVTEGPSLRPGEEEYIQFRVVYELNRGTVIDPRELLSEAADSDNHVEFKRLNLALTEVQASPVWQHHRSLYYDLGISRAELEACGGVVYITELDLVVGFSELSESFPHPYSPPGQRQQLSATVSERDGFYQRYLLVDNANRYGSLWLNTGHGVHEIRPIRKAQLADGVYLTTAIPGKGIPTTKEYRYEEAVEQLGLYPTRNEAISFGAPEERSKLQARQVELEVQRERTRLGELKNELEALKLENEAEQQRLEREKRAAQEEYEYHKELMRREQERIEFQRKNYTESEKFRFEQLSRERKDRSEFYKALYDVGKAMLGLATLGLSLYAAFRKNAR